MFLKIAENGRNYWWLYLLGIVVIFLGTIIGQLPMLVWLVLADLSNDEMGEMAAKMDFSAAGLDSNATLFFMLLAFAGGMVGLWFAQVLIHGKKFRHLATPNARVDWAKIGFSFSLWMMLAILAESIFFALHPGNYEFQFQKDTFWVLLLISLMMFPVQTSWEELVFRGYLMQGISLISKWRWIPLTLTSIAFGLMHLMNEEVAAFGFAPTMTYFIGTGLFLAIVTLMDDSLELALGIHAATNIYSSIFVTFEESSLKTSALFRMKSVSMTEMLAAFLVCALVFVWIISKKYGWDDWKAKLLGPVKLDEPANEPFATN